jgi:GxxExxY protein
MNHRCTQMHTDDIESNRVSERIIGCGMAVLNTLGAGFLEKVYENALAHELRRVGLSVAQQQGVVIRYDGVVVGEYAVDLWSRDVCWLN